MKHFLGYLAVTDNDGVTTELINGTRALALMTDGCRAHAYWTLSDVAVCRRWAGVDCWTTDEAEYTPSSGSFVNPDGTVDPWVDAADERTDFIAGFIPDAPGYGLGIMIESPTEERVVNAAGVVPLEMFATGTVIAGSEGGEHVWLQWAKRLLEAQQPHGWTLTVITGCSDQTTWTGVDVTALPAITTNGPTYTTWDDVSHATFSDGATQAWPDQSGIRQLFGARPGAIAPLADQPLFDHDVGRRYSFAFNVRRRLMFDRPRLIEAVTGAWALDEIYTLPLDVADVAALLAADGVPGLAIPERSRLRPGLQALTNRWRLPDAVLRKAVLTPKLPDALRYGLVISVTNPSATETIYNARIRTWGAIDAIAPPDTQLGDTTYKATDSLHELRITALGPGETITADSRSDRVTVVSATETLSLSDLSARAEGVSAPPIYQGGSQLWVCAEMSSSGAHEVQTLTVDATGGTFTLTFAGGIATAPISGTATAGAVQTAILLLAEFTSGDVVVTGGPGDSGGTTPYVLTFGGAYEYTAVALATADGASLTGGAGTATVVETTAGLAQSFGDADMEYTVSFAEADEIL